MVVQVVEQVAENPLTEKPLTVIEDPYGEGGGAAEAQQLSANSSAHQSENGDATAAAPMVEKSQPQMVVNPMLGASAAAAAARAPQVRDFQTTVVHGGKKGEVESTPSTSRLREGPSVEVATVIGSDNQWSTAKSTRRSVRRSSFMMPSNAAALPRSAMRKGSMDDTGGVVVRGEQEEDAL